jgi:hypothetical protein
MVEEVLRLRQAQASVQVSQAELSDIGPTGTISIQPTRNGAAAVHLEPSDHNTVFITIGEHCFCEYWHTDENADRLVPGVREIFEAAVAGDIYVEQDIHDSVIGTSRPYLKLADGNWHPFNRTPGASLPIFRRRHYHRIDYKAYATQ